MKTTTLQDQKSEATKAKVMDATRRIAAQYGVRYLTVRNICEEAGVSSGSFYHHFGTKENLIALYLGEVFRAVREDNPFPESAADAGAAAPEVKAPADSLAVSGLCRILREDRS